MPRVCWPIVLLLVAGCGLTVTNERPTYDQLSPVEKSAVDTILAELSGFDTLVKQCTKYNIDEIVNRERIHVSFEGLIFSANLGDQVVHVSVWENLGEDKQALVESWYGAQTKEQARAEYARLFYQFLAVAQGAKQFMYKVLTPTWVYTHRTWFNIERDSIRTALAYYVARGKKAETWSFLAGICAPVLAKYGPAFSSKFDKKYLQEHLPEIVNPDDPSGYMYFICRWINLAQGELDPLCGEPSELQYLIDLPKPD